MPLTDLQIKILQTIAQGQTVNYGTVQNAVTVPDVVAAFQTAMEGKEDLYYFSANVNNLVSFMQLTPKLGGRSYDFNLGSFANPGFTNTTTMKKNKAAQGMARIALETNGLTVK